MYIDQASNGCVFILPHILQIEKLEIKQSNGAELNPDQLDKLSRKQDVLDGLKLLQED